MYNCPLYNPCKWFYNQSITDQLQSIIDFKILSTNTFYCQQVLCVSTQVHLTKTFVAIEDMQFGFFLKAMFGLIINIPLHAHIS